MSQNEVIIGIDLGTTNSLVGLVDTGFPVLIPDNQGNRLTPSVASFHGEKALVGWSAKRQRAVAPKKTFYSVKRFIGRRFSDLQSEEKEVGYDISAGATGKVTCLCGGQAYLPENISSLVLAHLKEVAENYLHAPVTKAVITVPAYFNDAQRTATKDAGRLAGLTVERILNEPTAAALAYGLDRKGENIKVAVFDLGGGTFDLSILELREGLFQVLATNGNTRLGGDDIDMAVASELMRRLRAEGSTEVDAVLQARILEVAEEAKCRLSTEDETSVELPFVRPDFSFQTTLTVEELNRLAKPIIDKTRVHCLRALADAKLGAKDLAEVILVGRQTRMPMVRKLVTEIFQKEPNTSVNPDEAVALGAVIQAGILSGSLQNLVLLDVTPLSLGLETFGGLMNVLIPRNTTIPTKAGEQFTNAVDGQTSMRIHLLQGEREMARDNWSLGLFDIEFNPEARGLARVGVQFEVDANGILHVLARDLKTGTEKKVEMKSAVDVSSQEVERMVAESVEFALDDMQERRLVELKLKGERLLGITHTTLEKMEGVLSSDEIGEVRVLLKRLEQTLNGSDEVFLKKAIKELDDGTVFIAEKLMEIALNQKHEQSKLYISS